MGGIYSPLYSLSEYRVILKLDIRIYTLDNLQRLQSELTAKIKINGGLHRWKLNF
jgi:hypothetical protein